MQEYKKLLNSLIASAVCPAGCDGHCWRCTHTFSLLWTHCLPVPICHHHVLSPNPYFWIILCQITYYVRRHTIILYELEHIFPIKRGSLWSSQASKNYYWPQEDKGFGLVFFISSYKLQTTCITCFDFSVPSSLQMGKSTRGRLKNPTCSNQNLGIFSSNSTTISDFSDAWYILSARSLQRRLVPVFLTSPSGDSSSNTHPTKFLLKSRIPHFLFFTTFSSCAPLQCDRHLNLNFKFKF